MTRLLGVAALALWLAAPAAAAPPTATVAARPAVGFAPLRVTLSATGDAAAYHWDFGDGTAADGAVVSHTYAAGTWTATVTATSASGEVTRAAVTVRAARESIALRRPPAAMWGSAVTLRGRVASHRPGIRLAVYRGRTFVTGTTSRAGGAFTTRINLRTPGRYHVRFERGRSPEVAVIARPRLRLALPEAAALGGRLALRARLEPSRAGRLQVRVGTRWRPLPGNLRLATGRLGPVRVVVRLLPRAGFAGLTRTLRSQVVEPVLGPGSRGPAVRELERRLAEQRYALQRLDGSYDLDTVEAVYAFQRLHGLPTTGRTDAELWRVLAAARTPTARYPGTHIEVDKSRQVLLDVRNGLVVRIVHVSTGATGNTPLGSWRVYRKVPGFDWVLYYPMYFLRGFAIHGYPSVPPYPASHGCVRIPMWIASTLYADHGEGTTVIVY
jgi:lipoprotein-anchoring transpeptidase ErfK/SrfK